MYVCMYLSIYLAVYLSVYPSVYLTFAALEDGPGAVLGVLRELVRLQQGRVRDQRQHLQDGGQEKGLESFQQVILARSHFLRVMQKVF